MSKVTVHDVDSAPAGSREPLTRGVQIEVAQPATPDPGV